MEFPLDFVHYLYNYYMVCALLSHAHHMTSFIVTSPDMCHVILSCTPCLCSKYK